MPVPPVGNPNEFEWRDLLPNARSLMVSHYAIHEMAGWFLQCGARRFQTFGHRGELKPHRNSRFMRAFDRRRDSRMKE